MQEVEVFTDGACSGNPGPGGWGAILRCQGREKELCGGERETTNNRMELTAVLTALETLRFPCIVTVTTDSQYVADAVKKGWLENWQRKNWRLASGSPVKNRDLWERLVPQLARHQVRFVWVRGHQGHPENERCDALAVKCRDQAAAETLGNKGLVS